MTLSSTEPVLTITPLVTRVPATVLPEPAGVFARLRAAGPDFGLALLESCGPQLPTTRRSVVVARGVVRVVLRRGEATVSPLCPEGEPVIEAIAQRLGTAPAEALRLEVPCDPGDPGDADEDRLRAASALDVLRAVAGILADREPVATLAPGLFGALGYELVDHFEALPARKPDPDHEPDASLVLATDVIVYDHAAGHLEVVTRGLPGESEATVQNRHAGYLAVLREVAPIEDAPVPRAADPIAVDADVADDAFLRSVERLQEHIAGGDIFQAVISRGLTARSSADPLEVYRVLRRANPSPYMFYFELEQGALLGASPETFLRVEQGEVEIRPIAGTAPRGFDEHGGIDVDLDGRLALSLLLDPKEQAEHAMLLDLARNDVARVSEPGTCRVVQQFSIEKYSHVQHLVSRVRGRLRRGLDALHAYRAAANMGTLTGAPKVRAMELIRAEEPRARGFYGGAAGYLLQDGSFDSCIVIRSLRYRDGVYTTRAGAGIVTDSVPERELAETEHKSRACRLAIAVAEADR